MSTICMNETINISINRSGMEILTVGTIGNCSSGQEATSELDATFQSEDPPRFELFERTKSSVHSQGGGRPVLTRKPQTILSCMSKSTRLRLSQHGLDLNRMTRLGQATNNRERLAIVRFCGSSAIRVGTSSVFREDFPCMRPCSPPSLLLSNSIFRAAMQ